MDSTETKRSGKFIDIKNVIASKNPALLKMLPPFILNYLKKILHEDDLNLCMKTYGHLNNLDFIKGALEHLSLKIEVLNEENIPREGRSIVVANHPLGGPEGVALIHIIGQYRKDFKFIVNDLLMNLENIKELFLPVNKVGITARESLRMINDAYDSDMLLLTFPFGLVSRKRKGKIEDLDWKKSFISKARFHKRDIIPVHIDGRNSNFFYNLAYYRKKLGIKQNIEMLYLVNEMYKQRNKTLRFIFGKKVSYTVLKPEFRDEEWAELFRQHVYLLGKDKNAVFQNGYSHANY
jgi:putative hemolysin